MENFPFKLISTGDDILPFIFQAISSELGAQSTYATISLDAGPLYIGEYGIALVTSTSAQRIDLQIPDAVFRIARNGHQTDRVTAIRDFQQELAYFTFSPAATTNDTSPVKVFPSKTFLFNYRENTWATADENFTRYGTFRRTTNRTWATLGAIYGTWSNWTDPWNYGGNQAYFPAIVGGNQQGFVLEKGFGTEEGVSQYIQDVSGTTITSPDHNLNVGDFILISGMIGSTNLNGTIQQVNPVNRNTFTINDPATGTYLGGGVYTRYVTPMIQSKQFPTYWGDAYGVRIGTQRLLFQGNDPIPAKHITGATQANPCEITSENHGLLTGDEVTITEVEGMTQLNNLSYTVTVTGLDTFTLNGISSLSYSAYTSSGLFSSENLTPQITFNLYASQNSSDPSNAPSANSYLPFSNIVLTGPEPDNIFSGGQGQIWHRQSNSIAGDTVQFEITLSEDQMRRPDINTKEIELHAVVLDLYPGRILS